MANFLILTLPLLFLIIPIVFQVVAGQKMLNKRAFMKYWLISIFSIIMEVAFIFIGLLVSITGQQMKGISGLSPGIIGIGFFAIIILIFVIIIPYISSKLRYSNQKLPPIKAIKNGGLST